ncbi:MAG: class I SAM-dependent methyltransferase [bacterium]
MNRNKQHWDKVGIEYSKSWAGKSKEHMSLKEMDFINKFLSPKRPKNVLDIGIGNGRILANYLQNVKKSAIYGIDISEKMVDVCKKRFHNNPAISKLAVCDFSKEKAPFKITFDFISSIRVIKYNKNWPDMIGKISQILSEDGIAIFSMPNKYSLNVFSFHKTPFYRSSKKELKNICEQYNLEILDAQSFTRIPDMFYTLSNNWICAKWVIGMETFFSKIFGKTFLGRMLFLAVKKK